MWGHHGDSAGLRPLGLCLPPGPDGGAVSGVWRQNGGAKHRSCDLPLRTTALVTRRGKRLGRNTLSSLLPPLIDWCSPWLNPAARWRARGPSRRPSGQPCEDGEGTWQEGEKSSCPALCPFHCRPHCRDFNIFKDSSHLEQLLNQSTDGPRSWQSARTRPAGPGRCRSLTPSCGPRGRGTKRADREESAPEVSGALTSDHCNLSICGL